ncbi:MAG: CBS domain-containing protein [Terriglobales bacterium]
MKREPIEYLLKSKSMQSVLSISPDDSVYQAVARMAEYGIGALLVMERDVLVGILSERDYARKVVLKGRSSMETAVREIMTSPVVTVSPAETVEACMALMTERKFRHLPVVDGHQVVGIVSIGDLVKWIITGQERTIHQLENYISGTYPG